MPVQTRSKKTAAPHMPHRNTDPITMDPIEEHRRVVANKQAYNVHSLAEIVHRAGHRDPTFGRRDAVLPHSRRVVAPEEAARWTAHARRTGWAPAVVAQMTHENRRVPDHLRGAVDAELARRQAFGHAPTRQAFGHAPTRQGQRLPETILRRYGDYQKIVEFLSHTWGDLDERGRRNLERELVDRDAWSWVFCFVSLYEEATDFRLLYEEATDYDLRLLETAIDFMKNLRGFLNNMHGRRPPAAHGSESLRTYVERFRIDFNNLDIAPRGRPQAVALSESTRRKFKTYMMPLMLDIARMDHLSVDGVLGLVGQYARSHPVAEFRRRELV